METEATKQPLRFAAVDDEGRVLDCEALLIFEIRATGRHIIVYADRALDEDGSTKVYASAFDPEDLNMLDDRYSALSLSPLEETEWPAVETILDRLQARDFESLGLDDPE